MPKYAAHFDFIDPLREVVRIELLFLLVTQCMEKILGEKENCNLKTHFLYPNCVFFVSKLHFILRGSSDCHVCPITKSRAAKIVVGTSG
jgi:hypothetical protein